MFSLNLCEMEIVVGPSTSAESNQYHKFNWLGREQNKFKVENNKLLFKNSVCAFKSANKNGLIDKNGNEK